MCIKVMRFLLLLSLCAVGASLPARSSYRITSHLLINGGRSNNYVRDMTVDGKGRLWIATDSGLDVFDGVGYRCYNTSNSQLGANMINTVRYDSGENCLWVGTKGVGIGRIDPETGSMAVCNTPDSALVNVRCILPSQQGGLWIVCPNEIFMFDRQPGIYTPVSNGMGCNFRCAADDGYGNLIVGTHMSGAFIYNALNRHFEAMDFIGESDVRVKVNVITKDHFGRVWLATNRGVWIYRHGNLSLQRFEGVASEEIYQMLEIDGECLWFTSQSGIMMIDLKTEAVIPVCPEDDRIPETAIQKIYQDPYRNIWIGGSGSGIDFISHEEPAFRRIADDPFWGIFADGDTVWVGSNGKIMAYKGINAVASIDVTMSGRYNGSVISINGDGADVLYLAVPYHMLSYNKRTGSISEIRTDDGRSIEALTFYREDDGTFWITANDGVYMMRDGHVRGVENINRVLSLQSAHGLRRDKEGKLWVATYENGLYLFDSQCRLLRHLTQQTGFVSNSIQHLKFDSKGRLWISTPDGPCCIPDTRYPERYVSFGYRDGLRDTYVRAIQEDAEGNIWMSTNNGISMLLYDERVFINYGQEDHLPVNNMIGGAVMLSDGGLIFNSIEGLCYCKPSALTRLRRPSSIQLMSLRVLLSDGLADETADVRPDEDGIYNLEYDRGSFQLVFGSRDYTESRQLEYEYQIGRSDSRWLPCARGMVVFRNLQPGNYPIRVRARFKGQPWHDDDVLQVMVCVEYPWWSGLCARILYAIIACALVYVFLLHYRRRLKLKAELELVRRKNADEKERNAERLQFFTNITHELKTPLSLIQAPLEQLLDDKCLRENDRSRIQLVYDSALRLAGLCNKLLDFHRSERHDRELHVSMGRMGDVVGEVGRSFANFNSNPQLHIGVQIQPDEQQVLFDAEVVRTVVENLMSNAVKYTASGRVDLSLVQQTVSDGICTIITVKDTGYGIPQEAIPRIFDRYYQVKGPHQASGTGIGLAIVKSLVELHNATIQVESKVNCGTVVTVRFNHGTLSADGNDARINIPDAGIALVKTSTKVVADADSRPLVLLVEDDYQIVKFISGALSNDYVILTARNGAEGLDIAFARIPDLVVTDLMMPVMDGGTLCRTLKQDMRTCHIPIVMLTARDQPSDQLEGYQNGADSYLTKPFSLKMLQSRLQNLLASRARMAAWLNRQSVQQLSGNVPAVASAEETPFISSYDRSFLDNISSYVVEHLSDENIRMEDVALSMRISHSTLYRKVKALTGMSGTEYVRKIRVLQSAKLMMNEHCNVSEAAFKCGFSSLPYFRSAFKDVFGMLPSEYLKKS